MHQSPLGTPPPTNTPPDAGHSLDTNSGRKNLVHGTKPCLYQPCLQPTSGEALGALVGATLTVIDNVIYTFAGFDQFTDELYHSLHQLSLTDYEWKRVVYLKGRPPDKRNDHSTSYWPQENKLVIFGGSSEEDGVYYNNVALLDLTTMTWEHPTPCGAIPQGRCRHAATIHDKYLYISGGLTAGGQLSDALHILDLASWTWMDPIDFVARSQHTLAVHDQRLFLFGGMHEDLTRSNQLSYLDLNTGATTHLILQSDVSPPLHAQRYVQVCDHRLVVLATPSMTDNEASGIWTLDLNRMQWKCHALNILAGGRQPHGDGADDPSHPGCTWHGIAMQENDRRVYLFGTPDDDEEHADQYYAQVLPLDLYEYGIIYQPPSTLSHDLSSSVSQPPSVNSLISLLSTTEEPQDRVAQVPLWLLETRWPLCLPSLQQNTLVLPYSLASIDAIVFFLYHDTLPALPVHTLASLLVMAHTYGFRRLEALCLDAAWSALQVDTVSFLYEASCIANQLCLQHHTLHFIFDHFGPVSHSTSFRQLSQPCLLGLLASMPRSASLIYEESFQP
ncbi:galactose oxidase [Hesseltinella vesiculosa]|uniref:Galactose oxidase n=1 Tax=Hesseltinella vesiculosa TaxID=101127 RepID=A0A1X2GB29_9FUNG|nr:galactose oxidase [Hesseltinella vesiculosa]